MGRYSGRMTDKSARKVSGNKGIARDTQAIKRAEAEERQARYIADKCPCQSCTARRSAAA